MPDNEKLIEQSQPIKEEITELALLEETAESASEKKKAPEKKGRKKKSKEASSSEYEEFPDLAALLNTTVAQLKDEFFLFQIRKLMSRLGKVIVRYNVTDAELEKIFINADVLSLGCVTVAPIYLPACAKQVEKHRLDGVRVGSVIDFPFGESSFKGKLSDVKEGARMGVDEVTVTVSTMLISSENDKIFRKQIKKLGRTFKNGAGIALNATDLSEEKIKRAIKIIGKSKLSSITFAFGEATLEELKTKMAVINKYRGAKKIVVLANVDRAEAVTELIKLNADMILTPYADAIGEDLVKRFNVKSVKLR